MEGTSVLAVSPSGASATTFSRGEGHILRSIIPGGQPLTVAKEVVVSRDVGTVRGICLSPCARQVAAITDNCNRLILWDTNAEDLYTRLPTNDPICVTFSPDGQFVACISRGRGGMLSVWDFHRRLQVFSTPHGHKGGVTAVAYSADCSVIYSGSEDRTVRMRSASTGAPIGDLLTGHRAGVTCVVSSPDSQRVASGSSDGSIIIWDVQSCKATRRLWCHTTGTTLKCLSGPLGDQDAEYRCHAVTALAYSANGRRLISASTDGVVRIWDTTAAWRQYDASSDIWGHNVKVANALLGRLMSDLQFGSGADLRRNTTLLR
ncbi:WD40 repeat-like protein [Exidia glandulosa HHB12029]|uniref:WD40 repeat-like protein n=1 Tax=Exidia glandulosa HHB12029 TaxID=1314781 RepID=A0A165G1L5_EXIGL|nr:WD40 repeat-like protein [Exidia glandulosa HHB12029]